MAEVGQNSKSVAQLVQSLRVAVRIVADCPRLTGGRHKNGSAVLRISWKIDFDESVISAFVALCLVCAFVAMAIIFVIDAAVMRESSRRKSASLRSHLSSVCVNQQLS